jgi:hypothetical protein
MTKKEREELIAIIDDVQESDDKIDVLERLLFTVKRMVNYK